MRFRKQAAAMLIAVVSLVAAGASRAEVNIQVDIGRAPPPPRLVFREAPRVEYIPESRVYYVVDDDARDYDCFRYGTFWYVNSGNFWYRARSYRGPFTVIRQSYVPAAIWRVPDRRWKHHPLGGPPGQMKRREAPMRDQHDNGRGHGHGNH
jgi:hypothetical protein